MIINLDGKTKKELIQLLESIKTSSADYELKKKNIANIENKLYGDKKKELLKEIEDGMADLDDIN